MSSLNELTTVALLKDLSKHGLKKGDVGAVLHILSETVVEVEFVNTDGSAKAVIPVPEKHLIKLNLNLIPA